MCGKKDKRSRSPAARMHPMAESGIVRIYRKVSSFYFSLLPEPFLWFLLLIWLIGFPQFFTQITLSILYEFSPSSCVIQSTIPVSTLIFSLLTGLALAPRKGTTVCVVLAFLNIIFCTFVVLNFLSIFNLRYHAFLALFFAFSVKTHCAFYGSIISIFISSVVIVIFLLLARLRRMAD